MRKFEDWVLMQEAEQQMDPNNPNNPTMQAQDPNAQAQDPNAQAAAAGATPGANPEAEQEVQGLTQSVNMYLEKLTQAMDKATWNKEKRLSFIGHMLTMMSQSMGLTLPEIMAAVTAQRKAQ